MPDSVNNRPIHARIANQNGRVQLRQSVNHHLIHERTANQIRRVKLRQSVNHRPIHARRASQIRRIRALVPSGHYLLTSHSHQELHQEFNQELRMQAVRARLWFSLLAIEATGISRRIITLPLCWNQHL
jgi:hypothetical protein